VGVRGTAGDVIVKPAGNLPAVQSNIASVTIVLIQGIMTFTFGNATYTLDVAGTAYTFFANGTVQGPQRWDGTIINTGSEVTHPLYGWYFQGEQPNNGLPNVQLGNIDQLNGLLQQTLKPPVGGGGGGGGDETFIPARRR
jgi:hypothetical protein